MKQKWNPPLGHVPLWLVRQLGITQEELTGVKKAYDSFPPQKYVLVVRFDMKERKR